MLMKCLLHVNKQKTMHIPSAKATYREQRMSVSRHMRWLQQVVQRGEKADVVMQ